MPRLKLKELEYRHAVFMVDMQRVMTSALHVGVRETAKRMTVIQDEYAKWFAERGITLEVSE